jgi:pectate lyase
MKVAERLGQEGEVFARWAAEDLAAFAKYSYDPQDNSFRPLINDGTPLSPADRKRDGYVSERWLSKRPAEGIHFWVYALGYRVSGDALLWRTARRIGKGLGLGDIVSPGRDPRLDPDTTTADVDIIFGLLDLHEATGSAAFLDAARHIGDNLLEKEFHKGFFVADKDHLFTKIDTITPLALLHLHAALRGLSIELPEYAASKSYFHCPFDGAGRTYDNNAIYTRVRAPASASSPAAGG